MTARRARDPAAADGFTLIELLIAISILGMIATAVVGLILTSLRTTRDTRERLNDTGAYMITSGYFGPDVQGADRVVAANQPGFPKGTAKAACGNDADPLVVQLTGTDFDQVTAGRQTTVSYVLVDDGRTLVRRLCSGGEPQPRSDLVMAEGLAPARPPTATCQVGSSEVNCDNDSSGLITLTLSTAGGVTESIVGARRTA